MSGSTRTPRLDAKRFARIRKSVDVIAHATIRNTARSVHAHRPQDGSELDADMAQYASDLNAAADYLAGCDYYARSILARLENLESKGTDAA